MLIVSAALTQTERKLSCADCTSSHGLRLQPKEGDENKENIVLFVLFIHCWQNEMSTNTWHDLSHGSVLRLA